MTQDKTTIAVTTFQKLPLLVIMSLCGHLSTALAQIDPNPRSLLQLGLDQSLSGQGPNSLYAYYYYNRPGFLRTNVTLRLAVAPVYFDGEIGFRQLLSPNSDLGIGISGGGFGENYYEVREGHYLRGESFEGHGGGGSLKLYHRINPNQRIPLSAVLQGGAHYSTYSRADDTDDAFQLPDSHTTPFTRIGLRYAGKEPMLYPDLAMEVSIWAERQWRLDKSSYGYQEDRRVQSTTDLYWLYAGLNYAWTNTGHQLAVGVTAGGSQSADRLNAWRLGGVLPLASEFPLTLPGYYYQEISARRFAHLSTTYVLPLSHDHRWQLRLNAAAAHVDPISGLQQRLHWHSGVGPGLSYTSRSKVWRVILRYGYAFTAVRDNGKGAQSVGLLMQHDFERHKPQ